MGNKTKADPTGQKINRRKAAKSLIKRVKTAKKTVLNLFLSLESTKSRKTVVVNADDGFVYDYRITPEELRLLENQIRREINSELLGLTDDIPDDWFWTSDIELSHRQAALEETRDYNAMVTAAIAAGLLSMGTSSRTLEPPEIIYTDRYIRSLKTAIITAYEHVKSLADRLSNQVINRVRGGIQAGMSPTDISDQIRERFDVGVNSSVGISTSTINSVYNDSKINTAKTMSDVTGVTSGVIHISALLPTTRVHHANRHGNAYSVEDQIEWWNTGANRINCHCTTRSILIGPDGKVVDKEIQDDIKSERSFFDR